MSDGTSQRQIVILRAAGAHIRAYCESARLPPGPKKEDIERAVREDYDQGSVIVSSAGFTAGASRLLLGPARQFLIEFSNVKRKFSDAFQPFQSDLNELDAIPGKITQISQAKDIAIARERTRLDGEPLAEEYRRTKAKYDSQVEIHPSLPNLRAVSASFPSGKSPLYLVVLLLVGIAEYFINYRLILDFLGIPFAAFASASVLAAVLAAISHVHGSDVKQWQHKFGRAVRRSDRPYIPFFLATIGLFVLLSVVGWMRYEAVLSQLGGTSAVASIIPQAGGGPDLGEEIVISLGANLLAWFLGVFLAISLHDADPIYVDNAIDFMKAERAFRARKKHFDEEEERLEADAENRTKEQNERARKLESDDSIRQAKHVRDQVAQLEANILAQARAFLAAQGSLYKAEFLRQLPSHPGVTVFQTKGTALTEVSAMEVQKLPFATPDGLMDMLTPAGIVE